MCHLEDTTEQNSIWIAKNIPKGAEKEAESSFEEIRAENFPDLGRVGNTQIDV